MKTKKHVSRRKILFAVIGIMLLVFSFTVLTPLYYMFINSFKRIDDFLENGAWSLPKMLYFKNYSDVLSMGGNVSFQEMFINSAIFTFATVFISTATTTMTAYVLARHRFVGRNFLVAVGVGALVIPDLGSSSVIYKLFLDLNIMDSWFILIKYTTPFGLNFLMLYSLFCTISKSYTEAAELDGAGEIIIFTKICVPMAAGMIGAVSVISAIGNWSDYYTPYMYLPSIKMLSVGLQELAMTISQLNRPTLFAGMVIAVLPVLVLFIFMKDTIIQSAAGGGIKG